MADASAFLCTPRHAVVTGANKGIGLEICRQLATVGVTVVLTSRDEKRGLEAVHKLNQQSSGDALLGEVVFHQLDVSDSASVDSLAEFIRTCFGKLDILVNNAGISGTVIDYGALTRAVECLGGHWPNDEEDWKIIETRDYKLAVECLETNYYGAKRVTEALLPLLRLSSSARIVNVSSISGSLQKIPGDSNKNALRDIDNLTEDRIDDVLKGYLEDFRQGQLEAKGWPMILSAYKMSKVAMNTYTRVLAKELPTFLVNCVCPGFVKTDITGNNGFLSAAEGAESPVSLALLPETGPSGLFFFRKEITPF